MAATFFFYDLETSGFNPRDARIMQFAGIRTDMQLKPIGEPFNYLIKLSEDIVPEPDAILVTGITPQKTLAEGISEADFLKIFHEQIAIPDTIFVGYNTVRFDDEFMRYMHYRNFYDPYEWQWIDGKSRWDMLDVVRMTRALRPDGIEWPLDSKGRPTNRLELITTLNKLDHANAHDALSDVRATIGVSRMIRNKQPKLFDFLLQMRKKEAVAKLAHSGEPFLYTSGKYNSDWEKTTAVGTFAEHPKQQAALVFDLRYDPTPFTKLNVSELAEAWRRRRDDTGPRLPVKLLKFNRCPAVAPLSVLDDDSKARLELEPKTIAANYQKLKSSNLSQSVLEALEALDSQQQTRLLESESDVDARLYDGFIPREDKPKMSMLRAASPEELSDIQVVFKDQRLQALLPLYKARNYPQALTDEERSLWEEFKLHRLMAGDDKSRLSRFFARLAELSKETSLSGEQQYLLEELQLYGQSIMPVDL